MKKLDVIPAGDYCYTIKNIDKSLVLSMELCPYWKRIGEKYYCEYLDEYSEYGDLNLLWDQVKLCAVNYEQHLEEQK